MSNINMHIIDLDNVLHVGTKAGHGKKFNVSSFPTGGIYNLMGLIRKTNAISNPNLNKIVFVYDTRKNFRKEIMPAYKANRKNKTTTELTRDKAVGLQKKVIIETLTQAGFPVIGVEGYEADDIMFNIVLHYACHPEQPLQKGTTITLHTSDGDWIGAMALSPNIFYSATVNQSKLKNVKSYYDYYDQVGEQVEDCYISRALNGDNDGYAGFAKTFREVTGTPVNTIYQLPGIVENFSARYWDSNFWKEAIRSKYSQHEELMRIIELQINMAFPMFMESIFNEGVTDLISRPIDKDSLKSTLNILRVNVLKTQIGELEPYSDEHERKLDHIKAKHQAEYGEVFEMYRKIEFLPDEKITTDQVDIAFGLTI